MYCIVFDKVNREYRCRLDKQTVLVAAEDQRQVLLNTLTILGFKPVVEMEVTCGQEK